MKALQLVLVLSATYILGFAQPPPPPPQEPPPPPPMPTEECQPNFECESAYQAAVMGANPCQAAQDFKFCTGAAMSLCSEPIPSLVQAMDGGAQAAVAEKCNQVPEQLPACAASCVPYEDLALGDWANSQQESGCGQYGLYKQCLQNFFDSVHDNCEVSSFLSKAVERYTTDCPNNCTDDYNECSRNLPKLSADGTKLRETCLLWSVCKRYDFSPCQETLMLNYDTKCGAQETTTTTKTAESKTDNRQNSNEENSNGALKTISNLGLVCTLGLLCFVLLL